MTYGIIEEGLRSLLSPAAAEGTRCSAADLYRFAAGEATAAEAAAFEAHLAGCQDCRADLARFRSLADDGEERTMVRARLREALNAAAAWRSRWRLVPALAAAAVAAAAATAVLAGVVVWQSEALLPEVSDARLQVKAAYRLHAAIERAGERFVATSGEVVMPGDVLGFFYTAPAATYVVLLAAASNGTVLQAFPEGEQRLLAAGAEQRLAIGAVVDPGGECEWVVAFFSPAPLDIASLRAAVQGAVRAADKDCSLPPVAIAGMAVDVLALRKTQP